MKKQLLIISLLIAAASTTVAQNYSGGSGTVADPYQIANKADLKMLSDSSSHWAYNFIQTADIMFTAADFASTGAFYYGGAGFSPIGNSTTNFTGSYNGNYQIIDSLYINRPAQIYVALFGYISNTGIITSLGCTNTNINGQNYSAGLAGENDGIISNCYSSGSIIGQDGIGGLAGENDGTINTSCSNCSVRGSNDAGGLVGFLAFGSINNSYSIGSVGGPGYTGGLVGSSVSSTINNCYSSALCESGNGAGLNGNDVGVTYNSFWNTDVNAADNSVIATGITTTQMRTQATFTAAGWDFTGESTNGTADIWMMGFCGMDGISYPVLSWQKPFNGSGTISDPYLVATKNDLKTLSESPCLWNKNFVQIADITFTSADFDSSGAFYNAGLGFSPIGNNTTNFTGSYNGNYHLIDSLYISRASQDYIGLFGFAANTTTLSNLGCTNSNISGRDYTGGLVGESQAIISNSYSSGSVIGQNNTGGLVGLHYFGSISNSYSSGSVIGHLAIGGLVGENNQSTISNSYSSNTVSGPYSVGGLVGENDGTVNNCYSIGFVSGQVSVGGLAGLNYSQINHSFWDIQTSGWLTSAGGNGGGTGDSTTYMQTESTFTNSTWDFIGETNNGTNDIWQMNCATNNGYPILYWQTLNPVPTATTSSTNVLCNGGNSGSATVSVINSIGALNYNWQPSGGSSATASNLAAGSYTCTIEDASTCVLTQTVTITEPSAITSTQSFTVCAGTSVTVGSNTYSTSGIYNDVFNAANGCDSTVTTDLTVGNAIDNTTSTSNETITANATGVSYQWIDCNNGNTAIVGATSQSFTASANGNYAVVITSGACSDTSACVAINSVGLKNVSVRVTVSVYPNPSAGIFVIDGLERGTNLDIVNVIGQVVYSQKTNEAKTTIDLSNQANGVYFIKNNNGYSHKLIKQD